MYIRSDLPIYPTPSFLLWCPYVCSLHLCLYLCFSDKIIYTIFLDSTYTCEYAIFFFFSLSDLFHSVRQPQGPSMFLQMTQFHSYFMANIPLYMYHIFFIYFSADGLLVCFHVPTVVNSAAMNIGVHVSF